MTGGRTAATTERSTHRNRHSHRGCQRMERGLWLAFKDTNSSKKVLSWTDTRKITLACNRKDIRGQERARKNITQWENSRKLRQKNRREGLPAQDLRHIASLECKERVAAKTGQWEWQGAERQPRESTAHKVSGSHTEAVSEWKVASEWQPERRTAENKCVLGQRQRKMQWHTVEKTWWAKGEGEKNCSQWEN